MVSSRALTKSAERHQVAVRVKLWWLMRKERNPMVAPKKNRNSRSIIIDNENTVLSIVHDNNLVGRALM